MVAIANLVHQITQTSGTGNLTLSTLNGRQNFNAAFSVGGADAFYYFITSRDYPEWEVGTGHLLNATTLVRDTVLQSSNSNARVNFSGGYKDVTNALPSNRLASLDAVGVVEQDSNLEHSTLGFNVNLQRYVESNGAINAKVGFDLYGNGLNDDTAGLQSAANSGEPLYLPPTSSYYVVDTVPVDFPINGDMFLESRGAEVRTADAIPIFRRTVTNQSDFDTAVNHRCFVSGLILQGTQIEGQTLLQIGPSYGSVIEKCHFIAGDIGIDLQGALMATVLGCRATLNRTHGFVARYGTWTGATSPNSPSSSAQFIACRNFALTGSTTGFWIFGTSGVRLQNCIVEGGNPTYNVHFNNDGSTVVKDFIISSLHLENAPTSAHVKLRLTGGRALIDGMWAQLAGNLVDASESLSAVVDLGGVVYWPANLLLKNGASGGASWIIRPGAYGEPDFTNSAMWDGGNIPTDLQLVGHVRASAAGTLYSTGGRPMYLNGLDVRPLNSGINLGTDAAPFGKSYADEIIVGGGSRLTKFKSIQAPLNFGSIAAGEQAALTITLTGAATTHMVLATPIGGTVEAGLSWSSCVSATDTIEVRLANNTAGAIDPGNRDWRVAIFEVIS